MLRLSTVQGETELESRRNSPGYVEVQAGGSRRKGLQTECGGENSKIGLSRLGSVTCDQAVTDL